MQAGSPALRRGGRSAARWIGCRGRCDSGRRASWQRASKERADGPNIRLQAGPAESRPATVSSIERTIETPPSSRGWARSTSGQAHSRPCRSRPSVVRAGTLGESGCAARAIVMDEARDRQLAAARSAADRLRGLDHGHSDPAARERCRAGEAVRAGADDDRLAHVAGVASESAAATETTGNGRSSNHGCRSTMSATLTHPSSTRPVAASKIR